MIDMAAEFKLVCYACMEITHGLGSVTVSASLGYEEKRKEKKKRIIKARNNLPPQYRSIAFLELVRVLHYHHYGKCTCCYLFRTANAWWHSSIGTVGRTVEC